MKPTLYMLKSALYLWKALSLLSSNFKIDTKLNCERISSGLDSIQLDIFSPICQQNLLELVSLLEYFEKFTLIIQTEKLPTIVEGCLIYNRLFMFFNEKIQELEKSGLIDILKLMKDSLEEVCFISKSFHSFLIKFLYLPEFQDFGFRYFSHSRNFRSQMFGY